MGLPSAVGSARGASEARAAGPPLKLRWEKPPRGGARRPRPRGSAAGFSAWMGPTTTGGC